MFCFLFYRRFLTFSSWVYCNLYIKVEVCVSDIWRPCTTRRRWSALLTPCCKKSTPSLGSATPRLTTRGCSCTIFFPPCHVPPLNLTLPTGILKHLLIPHFYIQSCNIWQLVKSNRNYLCVTPWCFKSFRKKNKENIFTCKLKNDDLECIFVGRPTLLAYHPMFRCLLSIFCVLLPGSSEWVSCWVQRLIDRKLQRRTGNPSTKPCRGTRDALTRRFCRGFYFEQKYSYIRYGFIFFLFTAKYNRFPVLLITPKHIMYIQLTSPLSHSQFLDWIGIIFQDFHLHNEKKRKEKGMKIWVKLKKAKKKETDKSLHMVEKDTRGDIMCGRSESKPGTRWFYTMIIFQRQEVCQFSAVVTEHHIGNMAHWRLACTLTTWKLDLTTCRVGPPTQGRCRTKY